RRPRRPPVAGRGHRPRPRRLTEDRPCEGIEPVGGGLGSCSNASLTDCTALIRSCGPPLACDQTTGIPQEERNSQHISTPPTETLNRLPAFAGRDLRNELTGGHLHRNHQPRIGRLGRRARAWFACGPRGGNPWL